MLLECFGVHYVFMSRYKGHVREKCYNTLNYREQTHLLLKKMMVLEQKLKSMEMKLKNVSYGVCIIEFSLFCSTGCCPKDG